MTDDDYYGWRVRVLVDGEWIKALRYGDGSFYLNGEIKNDLKYKAGWG